MMYWLTNLVAIIGIFILILFAWKTNSRMKIITTINISIMSIFVALSIVLTNIIGYSFIFFGKQMQLGRLIIFTCGMLMGPICGIIVGLSSDVIGMLINTSGLIHFGFTFGQCLTGFLGAMVFVNKNSNQFWIWKVFIFWLLAIIIQLFIIHPISMGVLLFNNWKDLFVWFLAGVVGKIITLILQMIFYSIFTLASFRVFWTLYDRVSSYQLSLWPRYKGNVFIL